MLFLTQNDLCQLHNIHSGAVVIASNSLEGNEKKQKSKSKLHVFDAKLTVHLGQKKKGQIHNDVFTISIITLVCLS